MSVLIETSIGELVIDLYCNECPITTKNFLKLCKIKYYNNCLLYNIQQNYLFQTGDPSGLGTGGISIYGILYGQQAIKFEDEIIKNKKHNKIGLVSMAGGENGNRSQFFITLRGDNLEHLDGKHTIFGEIAEGFDILEKINSLYVDENNRPYQDVRIRHTYILDDPFDDPPELEIPPSSPIHEYPPEERVSRRIRYEDGIANAEEESRTAAELEESIRKKEAESRAIVLEMVGDIPDADIKPPAEVLFVAKLNPITTDADLELIFSRFGKIKECSIVRDYKTGDSLNYAFIEFETEDAVLEAYEKMNNVLIDDRRIKVDFSQSVAKLWNKYLLRPREQSKPKPTSTNEKSNHKNQHYSRDNRDQRDHHKNHNHDHNRSSREHKETKDRKYDSKDSHSSFSSKSNKHSSSEKNDDHRSNHKHHHDHDKHRRSRSRSRSRDRHHSRDHRDNKDRDRDRDRSSNHRR